jgi:hypothetical protein
LFATVGHLKQAILDEPEADFLEKYVFGATSAKFDQSRIKFAAELISNEYDIHVSPNEIVVVGSSKIGFALHPKFKDRIEVKPAFRPYGEDSDVDLSIFNSELFCLLWHEISALACKKNHIPVRLGDFGNYLAYGWLRLDQLPSGDRGELVRCQGLKTIRGKVRKDRVRGHAKVDFGLFHDRKHLELYQRRSLALCRKRLENPL